MSYDDVKGAFQKGGASMRCSEVTKLLESLGFEVRDGKRGGHKIFKHPSIPSFYGSDFNCGHKKNNEVKRVYLKKILSVLNEYEVELERF